MKNERVDISHLKISLPHKPEFSPKFIKIIFLQAIFVFGYGLLIYNDITPGIYWINVIFIIDLFLIQPLRI